MYTLTPIELVLTILNDDLSIQIDSSEANQTFGYLDIDSLSVAELCACLEDRGYTIDERLFGPSLTITDFALSLECHLEADEANQSSEDAGRAK